MIGEGKGGDFSQNDLWAALRRRVKVIRGGDGDRPAGQASHRGSDWEERNKCKSMGDWDWEGGFGLIWGDGRDIIWGVNIFERKNNVFAGTSYACG